MSLEERTLVVRSTHHTFDERITRDLLEELFLQAGPVINVVLRPDHAFIEFSDKCSVGYALALMEGTSLYGQQLVLSPKIENQDTYKYVTVMEKFNNAMQCNPHYFNQYLPKDSHRPVRTYQPQYRSQTNYSDDIRNYREHNNNIKYSSYSDLNSRSHANYSNYSDNRDDRSQRDYDQFNRRHSYNNSHQNRYSNYHQQQQHHNRSFSNNSFH